MDIKTMDTKQFIDEFFEANTDINQNKTKKSIDRPEVYKFEKEKGKKLLEMNPDELLEMISTFKQKNSKHLGRSIALSSYSMIAYMFRRLWEYYNEMSDSPIRNPWYSRKLKGAEARKYLAGSAEVMSKNDFDEIISDIHGAFDTEMANYLECVVLLFFYGIQRPAEIPMIKEPDINFKSRTIYLYGRSIKISDRALYLLQYVHKLNAMPGFKYDFVAASWHDSYFKFIIRESNLADFQNTDINKLSIKLSQLFTRITKEIGKNILPGQVYNLGLYLRLVDKYGEDDASIMVMSLRDEKSNHKLMEFMDENGYKDSVTRFKYIMIPYFQNN